MVEAGPQPRLLELGLAPCIRAAMTSICSGLPISLTCSRDSASSTSARSAVSATPDQPLGGADRARALLGDLLGQRQRGGQRILLHMGHQPQTSACAAGIGGQYR